MIYIGRFRLNIVQKVGNKGGFGQTKGPVWPAAQPAPVNYICPRSGREVFLQVGCQLSKGPGDDAHIVCKAAERNQIGNGIDRAHERDEGRDSFSGFRLVQ